MLLTGRRKDPCSGPSIRQLPNQEPECLDHGLPNQCFVPGKYLTAPVGLVA